TLKRSSNFVFYDNLEELLGSEYLTRIAVTNRLREGIENGCLVIRPRNLVVGVGCNRNTSASEIGEAVFKVLSDNGLSQKSIRNLASIDAKGDEAGLLDFAKKHDLTIDFFTKEELEKMDFVTVPSRHVMKAVGVGGVCEPSAMLSSKNPVLLVPKVKSGNVTVAVAEAAPSFDKSI
ncbi:MAG: cobalamin biosynthesis protein, partial [Deltaproteobacteria bacterium]